MISELAWRLTGSEDLYGLSGRRPWASINFVTAHDGFTLRDLVSYDRKHNEANGEDNRDGTDDNRSQNFGVEGETSSPTVRARRLATARAMLGTLLLSSGTPMLLGGDELWRTQDGNNNAYCLDDPTSWVDWTDSAEAAGLTAFVARVAEIRRSSVTLYRDRFYREGDVTWWHPTGRPMGPADWHDHGARSLGLLVGEWLLLLHADTVLAPGWVRLVQAHMAAGLDRAAYFRFTLDSPDPRARRLERWVAWRCQVLALPYGDQGLLISRALLDAVGGIRPLPIMEDVDLVRRIGRARLVALPVDAVTSAARWEREGWRRRSLRNLSCLALWCAGVPPRVIARFYG